METILRRTRLLRANLPAFTLVELLVVMAVIGLLAGLLLTALANAKERARVVKCLSNLRQTHLALMTYVEEHNDQFPARSVEEVPPYQTQGQEIKDIQYAIGGKEPRITAGRCYPSAEARPLYPYVRKSEIFRCPADKGQHVRPSLDDGR